MAAVALEAPPSLSAYFDTAESPLNPRNRGFPFFVYGTLPLLMVRGLASLLGLADMAHLHLVGRVLAALFDLATVLLTWRLGRAVAGPRVGVAAAALMALCVASIQHAHFFTVDAFAACFAAGVLLATARLAAGAGPGAHLAFGACLAAAVACRINLLLLAPLYPGALAAALWTGATPAKRAAAGAALAVATGLVGLRVAHPYAFAGPGFADPALDPSFLENLAELRAMLEGRVDFPPAYQWIGRVPVLFALGNLAATSLGAGWAIAAAIGLAGWLRGRLGARDAARSFGGRLIALFALALLLYHGSQFVATQRYLLPVLPVLAVAAALLVEGPAPWQRAVFAAALLATALWAFAFHGIHRSAHPRVAASRWLAETLPPGATLAHEPWDDTLPLPVEGVDPARFAHVELPVYAAEDWLKRLSLGAVLDRADYVVLSSDRAYASIPRAPWRYPLARRTYELLFSGALGFRLERSFTSFPRLGPLEIPDSWSEEAFRVYDHPAVHVLAKTDAYDRERVRALLGAVRLDAVRALSPGEGSAAFRRALPTSPRPAPPPAATGLGVGAEMSSGEALLRWLSGFVLLGCALLPLARRLLPEHPGLAGLLAIWLPWLAPGHGAWWLASAGLAPFSGGTAPALALLAGALGAALGWRDRDALRAWLRRHGRRIVAPAAAFLVAFAAFALLRAANPTIYWGEKPMDFAFLGALARARSLPPADPWFAGETLNYFHFGHALVVAFARVSGVPLAIAFNLALATAAGLAAAGAYAAGSALLRSPRAGVLAVLLTLFAGNLAAPRAWLAQPGQPVNFDFFWQVSRVIEGTINEFPFWSFLFGDLHAHVLALPFELALVAFGCAWLSGRTPPGARVGLTGWLLGAAAATNPWSLPLALAVQGGFLATAARAGALSWPGAAARFAALAATAFAAAAPFWLDYTPAAGVGVGLERGATVRVADLATVFGLFAFALAPALAAVAGREGGRPRIVAGGAVLAAFAAAFALRGPGAAWPAGFAALGLCAWWSAASARIRAACLLAALAGATVLAAETFSVSDRMNTVFKLHLQAWLLAAVAAAALPAAALGSFSLPFRRAFALGLLALGAAAASTSAAASWGLLRFPRMASPGFGLDGTRYLEGHDPDSLSAYRWLNREVAGIPVMLEGQGPPYGEAMRVAMHTGLPAPVGWEHHLVQQARDRGEVRRRAAEVDRFYATTDLAEAGRILDRFRADFVFVGPLERRRYPAAGLEKLAAWDRLEPVFRRGAVVIYATPGAPAAHKSWVDPVPDRLLGYDAGGPRAQERPAAGSDE